MTVLSNIITPSNVLTTTNTATVTNKTLTAPTVTGMVVSDGTANGVTYLSATKVLTSGSALTFDGTNLGIGTASPAAKLHVAVAGVSQVRVQDTANSVTTALTAYSTAAYLSTYTNHPIAFEVNNTEGMRLTSTGLGIGTSSPDSKLVVSAYTGGSFNTAFNNSGQNNFIVHGTSGYTMFRKSDGTELMRLDTSGNLGLGVTPSAWSGFTASQVGNTAIWSTSTNNSHFSSNTYYNGANRIYIGSDFATEYAQQSGQHKWFTAASGTAGGTISATQAMTLDASGNLGIGTTSISGTRVLVAASDTGNTLGSSAASVHIMNTNGDVLGRVSEIVFDQGTQANKLAAISAIYSGYTSSTGGALAFSTNNGSGTFAERARIDSSGNLLVGKTTTSISTAGFSAGVNDVAGSAAGVIISTVNGQECMYLNRLTSDGTLVSFRRDNSQKGTISISGSTTSYNTSSDYRLKNSIAPMTSALAKVAQLKPVIYKWNADGADGEGFIAHELAEVCPHAVTGGKDAVDADGKPQYQGIDVSFLVATLTAAIQELNSKFEEYKATHP